MSFKEQVYNIFRERCKSGMSIDKAKIFDSSSFPNANREQIKMFCNQGYAEQYIRNFSLTDAAVKEALEDL